MQEQMELEIPWRLKSDYHCQKPEHYKHVWLLLHGFQESSEQIFRRIGDLFPKDALILAPNAPFPSPWYRNNKWTMGYGWFFYDNVNDHYYIDMDFSCAYLKQFIQQQNIPEGIPISILGYSQGGYLAPFAALELNHVKQVIGINCRFIDEKLRALDWDFQLDAIHGELDETVDIERAQKCHAKIIESGKTGSFQRVADQGHKLSESFREKIRHTIINIE